ncbi:MAG: hypothetical protein QNK36_03625 [Colwellia sp.]|nr:hypothetical protein [Colwellia sp.]
MTESVSKHVQIGEWIFEVKMVRALKVSEYGKPYSAIANCNINGDAMYIDGLLTKNEQAFTKSDFNSFNEFCYKMGLKQFSYHRYQNGESITKDNIVSSPIEPELQNKAPTILT